MHIKNMVFTAPLALLVCGTVILVGCMNGVYTVSSSIDYDAKYNGLNYEVIKDDTASFDNRIFQEDRMPIIVEEDKKIDVNIKESHSEQLSSGLVSRDSLSALSSGFCLEYFWRSWAAKGIFLI